jgi:6-phosphofructokinase 1
MSLVTEQPSPPPAPRKHGEADDVRFEVTRLGEPRVKSPMSGVRFVPDSARILFHGSLDEVKAAFDAGETPPSFEKAGPREHLFFDASTLTCGIVTCGGLCPGLNDVIRAIVLSLRHHYGVRRVVGFQYGFEGLIPHYGHEPLDLTPDRVEGIRQRGGTILKSSRGPQNIAEMVDTLTSMEVGILFVVGGDGTLRGAQAIAEEVARRRLAIAVIGIPKTIDNDISYVVRSFGFKTAVAEARRALNSAHIEALGARNGVGLVKLMGRDAGFIAAYATLASGQVNVCLVPEFPFTLEAFLRVLQDRLARRGHAVVVVAEGAGQDLLGAATAGRDASGNQRFGDIGLFLRDRIREHFEGLGIDANLKYIDPSYSIRSQQADADDASFCLLLGQNAVHAGMSGRTNMVVGVWRGEMTHVPIPRAVSQRKRLDEDGWEWNSVLASTGQPPDLR